MVTIIPPSEQRTSGDHDVRNVLWLSTTPRPGNEKLRRGVQVSAAASNAGLVEAEDL